ncbi:hypothetical protein BDW02DRAFT_135502 [Decorospora gaudefroyi]|uniref:Uncharacterized protein n=1 Tax=Decorospora gaudefroyi TaxID=184978 RepID=A0A6A5JXW7_9PLEO|nr:hypothetical protein BDW02DRAFT_135502 [Decorospora gaudefroyi]
MQEMCSSQIGREPQSAGQFGCSAYVVAKRECARMRRVLEEVSIPCRVRNVCGPVANYYLRFSSELAGHGAGLQHAVLAHLQQCFPSMTPNAGHDMWSRTISRNEDLGYLPCVRLDRRPMRSANKIILRMAGRVVLALRRPAGTRVALVSSAGHRCRTPDQGSRAQAHAAEAILGNAASPPMLRLCWREIIVETRRF